MLLRKPKILALLQALVAPFKSLYNEFYAFKEVANYRAEHYGSVGLMEKVLNDHFDDVERRIFIDNAKINETEHYYDNEIGDPIFFIDGDAQFYHDISTYNVYGSDFTVFLPIGLKPVNSADEEALLTRIRAEIDYYKIYGPIYKIIWLN